MCADSARRAHADVPTEDFPTLPDLPEGAGEGRRVGVEIEFGALPIDRAARILTDRLGGSVEDRSASHRLLRDTELGDVELYLDTRYRPEGADRIAQAGVEVARQVVPLEIVTPPIAQSDLPLLDRAVVALRAAGAEGSRAHFVHGFGLHLNVALADPDGGRDIVRIARSFALLEPWLRVRDPMDLSRRLLPFTQPFPERFVDAVAALDPGAEPAALFDLVDAHVDSRNHGLDLFPAYAHLAPDRFARHPGATDAVSGRPAYHFRLPESRLDEEWWSLSHPWRRWWLVEAVAAQDDLAAQLAEAWTAARRPVLGLDTDRYAGAVTAALGPLADLSPQIGGPA